MFAFRQDPTRLCRRGLPSPIFRRLYSTRQLPAAFRATGKTKKTTYFAIAGVAGALGLWWVTTNRHPSRQSHPETDVPRLDGPPIARLANEPALTNDDVSRILSQGAYSFPINNVAGVSRYDGTQLASSSPCEDRFLHGIFPSPRDDGHQWMAWAVFDGHAGWQTADLLEKQLLPVVRHHLSQAKAEISKPPAAGDAVRNAMMRAFVSVDDSITKAALDTPQTNEPLHEKVKLLAPGYAGSCALLSLYDPSTTTLHVACTGDSRAVLGRQNPDGSWEAIPLSVDQTGSNADEIARINREHPGEEDTIAKDGRVLGFAVSRAFGDGRLKWPLELQQTLWRKFNGPAPLTPRYDIRTPPYMTAEPVVTATRIDPDTPSFLIMASDGLWDNLSNQQAVDLVGKWLRMNGAREENSEAAPPRYETLDFSHFRKGLVERRFTEARTTVQDENAAVHLVRNSLGGNHHELIASRLAFGAPFSRRLRDDITVQVVFFGHRGAK